MKKNLCLLFFLLFVVTLTNYNLYSPEIEQVNITGGFNSNLNIYLNFSQVKENLFSFEGVYKKKSNRYILRVINPKSNNASFLEWAKSKNDSEINQNHKIISLSNYNNFIRNIKSLPKNLSDKYLIFISPNSVVSGKLIFNGLQFRNEISGFVGIDYLNGVSYVGQITDGLAEGYGMVETKKNFQISGYWENGKLRQNSLTFISIQPNKWNILLKGFLNTTLCNDLMNKTDDLDCTLIGQKVEFLKNINISISDNIIKL